MALSTLKRDHIKKNLRENEYDVVIVGGGITGAGIALDASNRGMKVALVEMQDFAQGTSSRSTKLVHGGLRYLKQLQVGVVAETINIVIMPNISE
ncbi:FAD-dependent oxidoreductase, partial [Staphylococcus capitis]|uniref:FAD-dependent oxidoreductase n=1 Tax=Staphylococcus capitis TaxID=29388 RepID=UPI003D032D88